MIPAHNRVTTTDTITGWEIQAHLGIVGTQAVAGTWFGSDWLASWSDAFGGRSGTYQRQLDSLYSAALGELVQKAEMRGANWVVGVHIDFDEISGGGKQMFMVSLSGTAVIARQVRVDSATAPATATSASTDNVSRMVKRQELRRTPAITTPEDVIFLCEEAANECASGVAAGLRSLCGEYASPSPEQTTAFEKFFRTIPVAEAQDALYPILSANVLEARNAASMICACGLTDFRRVSEILVKEDSFDVRRLAVGLLKYPPLSYSPSDVKTIDELIARIRERAMRVPEIKSKKAMLRGEYTYWECAWGHENAVDSFWCGTCFTSRDGYKKDEFNATAAIALLTGQKAALEELFAARAG